MVSFVLSYYDKLYCVFRILSLLGSFQIIHEVIEIMFKVWLPWQMVDSLCKLLCKGASFMSVQCLVHLVDFSLCFCLGGAIRSFLLHQNSNCKGLVRLSPFEILWYKLGVFAYVGRFWQGAAEGEKSRGWRRRRPLRKRTRQMLHCRPTTCNLSYMLLCKSAGLRSVQCLVHFAVFSFIFLFGRCCLLIFITS